MTVPGFSVSDLIVAVIQLKRVYDSFFDKYENAQSRVSELAEAIRLFQVNLIDLNYILERSGRYYPGQDAFRQTRRVSNFHRKLCRASR